MHDLSTRARRVLSYLEEVGTTTATNTVIGDTIGAKTSTVSAAISELEHAGLVTIVWTRPTTTNPSGRVVNSNGGDK